VLHSVLRWLVGRELADDVVGDLTEQRRQGSRTGGLITAVWIRARARYWRAALGIVVYLLLQRGRALMRQRISLGGRRGELRHAIRSLRRTPWYSLTVVAVIALSMAIATTAFAVVDGVLFRPLPFPDADELYVVGGAHDDATAPPERVVNMISGRELADWSRALPETPLTGVGFGSIELEDGAFATVVYVDARYFEVLGTRPLAGGFREEQFARDAPARAVMLGHDLWQRRFGGAPDVVGRRIVPYSANSPPIEIAGVLPPGDVIPPLPGRGDVDAVVAMPASAESGERSRVALASVPRERLAQFEAALDAAVARTRAEAPALPPTLPEAIRRLRRPYDRADVVPLAEFVTARQRPVFALLFGMAVAIAALVVVNAGALAAARAADSGREVAIRRALGARARDLIRQAVVEQGALVAAGTALGLTAAPWLLAAVQRRLPDDLALLKTPAIDWRVAAFAVAAAAVAVIGITVVSVHRRLRAPAVAPALGATHGSAPRARAAGRVLVAAQTAIAFAILLGGSLLAASLARVWDEDPGFRTDRTALVHVRFGEYAPRSRGIDLVQEMRRVPGVASAAALDALLLRGFNPGGDFRPPAGAAADIRPFMLRVSGGFFDATGIGLRDGRLPTDAELDTGAPVVVVSESVARAWWPGSSAVGRTLTAGRRDFAVAGVVADARLEALDLPPTPAIYAPLASIDPGFSAAQLFVALEGDADTALGGIVAHLTRSHPDVRLTSVDLLDDALSRTIRPRRFTAFVGSAFGSVAIVFVVVGVLGVVAMSTARRTREIGVRMALGSTPDAVVRLLLREQWIGVGAGLLAGAIASVWLVGLLESHVYGLTVYDIRVWVVAAAAILGTASLGTLLPALRASRIDPVGALRAE
jgi:predicted permease